MKLIGRKVLVIDDSPHIRQFLVISMRALGAQVYEADTAASGLALARLHLPDLVILDIGLPDASGLEILPLMKKNGAHVLVLSVQKSPDVIDSARSLGSDGYLTKPFIMGDLLNKIGTIH